MRPEALHGAEDEPKWAALHGRRLRQRASRPACARRSSPAWRNQPLAPRRHILVRQRPMPSAPKSPAAVRRPAYPALTRTRSSMRSAHCMSPDEVAAGQLGGRRGGTRPRTPSGAASAVSPVPPPRAAAVHAQVPHNGSTCSAWRTEQQHGLPIRARHDRRIWLMPPRAVSTALAITMPWKSLARSPAAQNDRHGPRGQSFSARSASKPPSARRAGRTQGQPGGRRVELAVRIDGQMERLGWRRGGEIARQLPSSDEELLVHHLAA